MKRKNILIYAFALSLVFTACSNNKVKTSKVTKTQSKFIAKTVKFTKDNTTQILLDEPTTPKENIEKIVKHGDHWHVFTKDGKEHITYTDPYSMSEQTDIVSVVTINDIKNMNISKIKKHGDHYHVYTDDGTEYLIYEDPSSVFKNIKIEEYVGFHNKNIAKSNKKSDKKPNKKAEEINKNDDEVVKILVHGDHYHIYTKSGKEYVSYSDPRSLYPNAFFGQYSGTHEDNKNVQKIKNIDVTNKKDLKKEDIKLPKLDEIKSKKLELVSVVKNDENLDIVKILIHDDHYHMYTKDGKEYITYADPRSKYPNATVGKYEGNHTQENMPALSGGGSNNIESKEDTKSDDSHNIEKILIHEDHYHIYTKDGKEYITYTDPRIKYPDVPVGQYVGSHNKIKKEESEKTSSNATDTNNENNSNFTNSQNNDDTNEKIRNLEILSVLGKDDVDRFDIVKILVHENHYHIYDSKGREGITYTNPKDIYKNASYGEYTGEHLENTENKENSENNSNNSNNETKIVWPEGVTRIVSHKDHWHLYVGEKEIAVVTEDPRPHYKDAEYIDESNTNSDIHVDESEIFTYYSVKPILHNDLIPHLDENIKSMTNFGNLSTSLPIFGLDEKNYDNIFYWLHDNHYHAMNIKQIIQNAKAKKYGDFSAKEVVETLKYKIENKLEKLEYKSNENNPNLYQLLRFLKKYYSLKSEDIREFYGEIEIHTKSGDEYFNPIDFKIENGQIIPKKELPKLDVEIAENEKDDSDDYYEPIVEDKNEETTNEEENDNTSADEAKENENEEINNINISENTENENSDEKIIEKAYEKYSKKYDLTEEEFYDYLFDKLPKVPFKYMQFNDDFTVTIKGIKYEIKTGNVI